MTSIVVAPTVSVLNTTRPSTVDVIAPTVSVLNTADPPVNIIVADTDLSINYLNAEALRTLRSLEAELPCRADEVIGRSSYAPSFPLIDSNRASNS